MPKPGEQQGKLLTTSNQNFVPSPLFEVRRETWACVQPSWVAPLLIPAPPPRQPAAPSPCCPQPCRHRARAAEGVPGGRLLAGARGGVCGAVQELARNRGLQARRRFGVTSCPVGLTWSFAAASCLSQCNALRSCFVLLPGDCMGRGWTRGSKVLSRKTRTP